MVHVSAQPPSHPGRSDFPSPVGGSSQFPQGTFPCQSKLKHSSAYTPGRHGYNLDSTCERRLSPLPGSKPGSVTSAMPTTHREPLCPAKGVTLHRDSVDALSQSALLDLHRSYRLMRQTKTLLPTSVVPSSTDLRRLLRAPAGSWPFPTLSLRSL